MAKMFNFIGYVETRFLDGKCFQFRLLKFYVHSRMEAQAERHRALLNVRGLGFMLSAMPSRLVGYRLAH